MNDLTPKMNTSNTFQNNCNFCIHKKVCSYIERFDKAKEEVDKIIASNENEFFGVHFECFHFRADMPNPKYDFGIRSAAPPVK